MTVDQGTSFNEPPQLKQYIEAERQVIADRHRHGPIQAYTISGVAFAGLVQTDAYMTARLALPELADRADEISRADEVRRQRQVSMAVAGVVVKSVITHESVVEAGELGCGLSWELANNAAHHLWHPRIDSRYNLGRLSNVNLTVMGADGSAVAYLEAGVPEPDTPGRFKAYQNGEGVFIGPDDRHPEYGTAHTLLISATTAYNRAKPMRLCYLD